MNHRVPQRDRATSRFSAGKAVRMWFEAAVIAALLAAGTSSLGCSERSNNRQRGEITIGTLSSPVSAPIYVADGNGYFEDEGLDVTIKHYGSGLEALRAMLDGEVDLAACASVPIANAALSGEEFSVLGILDESDAANYIVGRRDLGVDGAESLAGKKVGTIIGSSAHYFLETYLLTHGVDPGDTTVVGLESGEVIRALVEGEVDAVAAFDPYLLELEEQLGDRAVALHQPDIYTQSWILVGSTTIVDERQRDIESVLRALIEANRFLNSKPVTARKSISDDVAMDPDHIERRWPDYRWQVKLDQSLILQLEEGSRWLIESSLATGQVPSFLEYVDTRPLSEVQPRAVTVVDADR